MNENLKYTLITLGVIIGLLFLTKLPGIKSKRSETIEIAKFEALLKDVKRLWNLAKQDQNKMLSVIHATSALSKLNAIVELDASRQLTKKLDVDFEMLRLAIQKLQQEKLNDINRICPGLALDHELDWTV